MQASRSFSYFHLAALLIAFGLGSAFFVFAAQVGSLSLNSRLLLGEFTAFFTLVGIYPFIPWFSERVKFYLGIVCIPLLLVVAWYFYSYLPTQAIGGVSGRQLTSETISDSTSNGIIEIGFAYPIYTPAIQISNNELFTKELNIFLRILDGNNEPALFRAIRAILPDSRLSVEATVNGLLSENSDFLFIPIVVPPGVTVEGKVVFVISNLNDGSTFDEALGRSYPGQFEIREPESGDLLYSFPMTGI